MRTFLIIILIFFFGVSFIYSQKNNETQAADKAKVTTIKWHTIQEAEKLNKKKPKKIFVDVYTDWCGWCKRYDATTFSNPEIAKYINENFYAVKFNAERQDSVKFKGKTWINQNPGAMRATHQLALNLLNGKLSYPTVVFLDEKMDLIQPVPGYMDAKQFEVLVNYFGSNSYKNQQFEAFKASFKGKIQ